MRCSYAVPAAVYWFEKLFSVMPSFTFHHLAKVSVSQFPIMVAVSEAPQPNQPFLLWSVII